MTEKSRWIWLEESEAQPQTTAFFRRVFEIASVPAIAKIQISASHIYRLYINGALVGGGPDRADPRFPYFDEYDISPFFKSGSNVVVILAHHYNWSAAPPEVEQGRRAWCLYNGAAGVRVEMKVGGEKISSDETWQTQLATGWGRDANPIYRFLPYRHEVNIVEYSLALEKAHDSAREDDWRAAKVLPAATLGEPSPREIPFLLREVREPLRVSTLAAQDGAFANLHVANEGAPDAPLTLQPKPDGAWLTYDFGSSLGGFPALDWESEGAGEVDIYVGEGGRNYLCDRVRFAAGRWSYESLDWRGARFLTLHFRETNSPVLLHAARFVEMVYPFEERGDFRCSDDELTELWHTCKRTAWSGVKDHLMDCIGREQALWIADVMVHGRALRAAFGDVQPVEKSLRQPLRVMHEDGVVPVPGPVGVGYKRTEKLLRWSEQPLTLAPSLRDAFWFSGDAELIEFALPKLEKLYAHFENYEDARGLLCTHPEGRPRLMPFGGWTPMLKIGTPCALNFEYVHSLEAAGEIAEVLQRNELAAQWRQRAERTRQSAREAFWDESRNLFIDGERDGARVEAYSLIANAWAALGGGVLPQQRGAWAEALREDNSLLPLRTPFDASLLLEALCKLDRELHVTSLLKEYFDSLIRAGEPTLPEFWSAADGSANRRGENSSACHPYGTGPLYLLHEYVLGVRPSTPGYSHVEIAPRSIGLSSACGRVPTVHGEIAIEWERADTAWEYSIALPPGVTATLRLRQLGWGRERVVHNGKVAWQADPWEILHQQTERLYSSNAPREVLISLEAGKRHAVKHATY
jgi:hypothetical protein